MKKSELDTRAFLFHILHEAEFITDLVSRISYDEFGTNLEHRYALVRSLEIMGEAAKNIPDEFCALHPEIPWKAIIRNRDKLIHGYFVVDYDVVWDTVTNDVPPLLDAVSILLGRMRSE